MHLWKHNERVHCYKAPQLSIGAKRPRWQDDHPHLSMGRLLLRGFQLPLHYTSSGCRAGICHGHNRDSAQFTTHVYQYGRQPRMFRRYARIAAEAWDRSNRIEFCLLGYNDVQMA
jgi:hypothetical protein